MKIKPPGIIYPENLYCSCCGDTMEQNRTGGICDSCAARISWLTENPFKDVMEDYAFDNLVPCCVYGFYPRKLIHGLKLYGKTYVAKGLGLLMAESYAVSGEELPDAFIPVPITGKKLRKRGYNQSELLAKHAAAALAPEGGEPVPVLKDVLVKPKDTASMRMSDAITRRNMLVDAFAVPREKADLIQGKKLVLVDDVLTTGSTADACARTLKDAGAARVCVLCFASSAEPAAERRIY